MRFSYTDTEGVERVLSADSLWQAREAVRKTERLRSVSIAAAEIATASVAPMPSDLAAEVADALTPRGL